ncbi:MAG: hypothetical protein HKO56_02805 [Bacteroidia bacterium]|nr:hypothetical protein [Bacteroidia bacterium]NNM15563.1 hypothetical protein [Bacteroidia bacterium]
MQKLKYFIQFLLCGMICFVFACNQTKPPSETITKAKNKVTELMCGLSSPELQERKETVIASLQKQLIETKELENGYAFKFPGTDEMVDELT